MTALKFKPCCTFFLKSRHFNRQSLLILGPRVMGKKLQYTRCKLIKNIRVIRLFKQQYSYFPILTDARQVYYLENTKTKIACCSELIKYFKGCIQLEGI